MALSSDPWDSTELVAYINEVWPGIVDEEFFAKPVAANFFRDLTPFAQSGGDIFHIPDVFTNAFSAQTQSTQATEVTTEAPTSVEGTLTINNHVYIATLLGDQDAQQIARQYSISEIYNRKAVGTLVEDLEGDLFALHSSVSTNTQGDTASVVDDVTIRLSLEDLESIDVPRDELAFFFHPLIVSGCKILSNRLGDLYETTRRKLKSTVNDLTRGLPALVRCESLAPIAI